LAHLLTEHAPRRAAPERTQPESAANGVPESRESANLDGLGILRRFSRAHLGVIAAVLVVAVLLAGWSLLRARPVAVATPLVVNSSAATGQPTGQATPPAMPSEPEILVHVLGAVHRPGVVTLPPRARVAEAIKKAGGLTRAADPDQLNLAQLLTDGQQIVIGSRAHPTGLVRDGSGAGAAPGGGTGSGGGSSVVIDLNSATVAQLDQLPGVGPVTADRILAWRSAHGRFGKVEELQEVDGIGPKTYAQIAPHVRI
jgi:competence protein ComEA